jgi:ABC-type multidrug transport system fused ATPase/permease subunit
MNLKSLLTHYRKSVLFALSLVVIEKTAWIIEPTVFGDVIDAMIGALLTPPAGSPVVPILVWVGVFGLNSGVGTLRRSRDEKIYLTIYNDLAVDIARKVQKGTLTPSRAAARAELSREVVGFYQYRLPDFIEQGIDVGGAVIALTIFDWRLGATCATILFPLIIIGGIYNRNVAALQKRIHDQQEDIFNVYSTHNLDGVRSYYAEMAGWKQKIANWGAFNFGVLRFFLLGIFGVILYVAIDLDDFTTGNIYSVAAYVWTFVTSSEYLPEQLESWTSMKEIASRLQEETE